MKEQAFAKSRVFPAALLIGLLGAIASSAWVTLSFASRSEADPGPTFPEPTPVIGGSIGIEDAAKSLASERPDVAALVDSISHRDSAALLSALNWDTVSCLPPNVRGGPSSAYCEKFGGDGGDAYRSVSRRDRVPVAPGTVRPLAVLAAISPCVSSPGTGSTIP